MTNEEREKIIIKDMEEYLEKGIYSYIRENPIIMWFRKNNFIEDFFIRNLLLLNPDYSNGSVIIEFNKNTIITAFPWEETDEGYDFWEKINTDYLNFIQQNNNLLPQTLSFDPSIRRFKSMLSNGSFFGNYSYGDYITTGFGTEEYRNGYNSTGNYFDWLFGKIKHGGCKYL